MSVEQRLTKALSERILILDGAMGTMIQKYQLEEADYRGEQFSDWKIDLKGNSDLLSVTRPDVIEEIHYQYLEAGADIIETNTFNAQAVSMEDYGMQGLAKALNESSATVARKAVDRYLKQNPDREVFVAGAMGPMNKTLSLSPDVNNPGYRAVNFDQVAQAYYEQIQGLVEGGVDLLILETIFDTLNAKAALYALGQYFDDQQKPPLPLIISGTITDASGRTLSGQTLESFYISIEHARPLSIGLNCSLGGKELRPYIEELSTLSDTYVHCYPNAGLPNALGGYDESPEETASILGDFARQGWINLAGGCCGTGPAHIQAIAQEMKKHRPRPVQTPVS